MKLDGLLPIYKPAGMVSKDISRILKKSFGSYKMGHAGTLDPMAQGVLPILWGQGTKLQDYLLNAPKVYECKVELGYQTDTLDKEGKVCGHKAFDHVTLPMVEEACQGLLGIQEQVPPLYSAVKYQGKPLYEYARKGKAHLVSKETGKKTIQVYQLDLLSFDKGVIHFRVQTSKGAYIRSLGELLCERLNTFGTLIYLKRTHSSGVSEKQCLTVEELEDLAGEVSSLREKLLPLEDFTLGLPVVSLVDEQMVRDLRNGRPLRLLQETLETYLQSKTKGLFSSSLLPRTVFLLDNYKRALAIVSINQARGEKHVTIKVKRGFQ